MKTKLINFMADGVVFAAVGAAAIGIWLLASEVLITAQKLHW